MIAKNIERNQIGLRFAFALLCVVGVAALAVFSSWHLSRSAFWYDESMQFWMSLGGDAFGPPHSPAGGFRDIIRQNAVTNLDPGGFTVIMWLWLKFGTGAVWQRVLPFVFLVFGMSCLGWMAWTRRRSLPFAILASLIPVCDPLLLGYATEVRAYSMEFAGIVFGCILLDQALLRREILPALFAGFGFALFLGSRYSFALFAAAAFFAFAITMLADKGLDRRKVATRLVAFVAPIASTAAIIFLAAFLPQYKVRISLDNGAYLEYFAPTTAAGKSWDYLFLMLARNLLGPYGIPLTLSALLGAAWLTRWRNRFSLWQTSPADAMFGLLALGVILISVLVWRWHPWDLTQKWSLWLHALSAVAIVRLGSAVLAWAASPAASGLETDWRFATAMIVGILALDFRLATYRRGGAGLAPVLAYLERAAPAPGSVAVEAHWYPTLRYFYEYGVFAGHALYPAAFRLSNRTGPKPLVSSQTHYLVTTETLEATRAALKGYTITRSSDLPDQLFRVEPTAAQATHSDD